MINETLINKAFPHPHGFYQLVERLSETNPNLFLIRLNFYNALEKKTHPIVSTVVDFSMRWDPKQIERFKQQARERFEVTFLQELAFGKPTGGEIVDDMGRTIYSLQDLIMNVD